jgi:hypothetical protein
LYTDATFLLDGVCFDYLATLRGTTWLWTSPADLAAFYDQVDASELCAPPATRQDYDFTAEVLIGLASAATGCDAAYRVITLSQDDDRQTQTLFLSLDVRAGCSYEIIEPLIMAVPPPPPGYTLEATVIAP